MIYIVFYSVDAEEAANALLELAHQLPPEIKTFEDKAIQVNTFDEFNEYDISNMINDDITLRSMTGIYNIALLNVLIQAVMSCTLNNNITEIKKKILLTLMRLKLDLTFVSLGVLFRIKPQTARLYFHDTLGHLANLLEVFIRFPSKEEILCNMPRCFSKYRNTRVILDATEIEIQKSKCLNCKIKSYSFYKGRHTCKFLIGVAPSGMIIYLSKAYGGRASDTAITIQENVLQYCDPGDGVMVDKGFYIDQACSEAFLQLIRPPFLKRTAKQFTREEALRTRDIARARVHVERSIQRIKQFRVLRNVIPWRLLPQIDRIMTVVAALTNLSQPILALDKY